MRNSSLSLASVAVFRTALATCLTLLTLPAALAQSAIPQGPSTQIDLVNTTQGPLWPPAVVLDENGNFVVVGFLLLDFGGIVFPVPGAALVSPETVPPFDADGNRDIGAWFTAPYALVRPLDLSPGSPDLDIVLYSASFGPPVADDSGAPRIPRQGDSTHNLNGVGTLCADLFPGGSQDLTYTRPSFPLHLVPIPGFQGDQVAYDPDTGEPFVPNDRSGIGCGDGCAGEDPVDDRLQGPITLGDWLRGSGRLKISLTDFDAEAGGYTAAEFRFQLENMLPNSLYTVSTVRSRRIPGHPEFRPTIQPDALATPNVIATDEMGRGAATFKAPHPFPDPATDVLGDRIIGVTVVYHSDHMVWGGCTGRLGPGVDIHAVFSTIGATLDLTDFVTVPLPSQGD